MTKYGKASTRDMDGTKGVAAKSSNILRVGFFALWENDDGGSPLSPLLPGFASWMERKRSKRYPRMINASTYAPDEAR